MINHYVIIINEQLSNPKHSWRNDNFEETLDYWA